MFPNVPLFPALIMQKRSSMPVARRRARMFCVVMLLNVSLCVLMVLSWNLLQNKNGQERNPVPLKTFWQQQTPSKSFWNREQQRLDLLNNPVIQSALNSNSLIVLPDWLKDTGPQDPCEPDYRVPTQIADYNMLPERFQDFFLHMHCRKYPMLINQPHICTEKPFLLMAIKSLIPHFEQRQAIRETWGRAGVTANHSVVTVFLLGNTLQSDHFPDLQDVLGHEAKIHKDLLQWDYRDSFFNLTLKEVLFHEWFSKYCPQAQYVLKGDDDVFVNTLRIIDFLEGLEEVKTKDLFIGDVINNASPHRNRKLKYFIPESVFVGSYPAYAGGGGYLYSGTLALRLYNISSQVALYPIDDVYTGMCLQKLGLVPDKHSGFKTFDVEEKYRLNPCIHRDLMLVHSRTPQETLRIWPYIVQPELNCQ